MARPRTASAVALALLAVLALAAAGAVSAPDSGTPPSWREVERRIADQQLSAAAEQLDRLAAAARAAGDDRELARALVRSAQVRIALGGYATALAELDAAAWPDDPLARAALELYRAHALLAYLGAYGWEIGQRERIVAGEQLDLERWTRDQIVAEADRAFARVWARRERLGEVAVTDFEYLRANDYPDRIRPTLRDAVAYLWAERLADSGNWSPAEQAELWKLDLAALAAGTGVEPTAERLADAGLHPLARQAAVLGELERWHRGRGETGAALEARLERLRRLHDAVAAEEDRALLRDTLAGSLPEFHADPWWAMGRARLAEMWRSSDDADALVRARALAVEGERAYPGTPGARACRHLRETIEAPGFGLESMVADAAGRRSLEVTHRNLDRLHLRAYRIEATPFESRSVVWEGWNEERIRGVLGGEPVASWTLDLPPTPDYRDHRTFDTPPLEARGRYLIVASAEPGFSRRGNRLEAVELELSDLVLLRGFPAPASGPAVRLAVQVVSGATGAPITGAEATLYRWQWEQRPERLARAATDAAGRVELGLPEPDPRRGGGFAIVVRHDGDQAIWRQGHWPGRGRREPAAELGTLVFTDRAIYRPGQRLLWKTLTYQGVRSEGRLRAAAGRPIEVRLIDPNGETVATNRAETNGFGTAAGELEIPTGRLLGAWRLETDAHGSAAIAVEEYKRPTFEVTLERPVEEPRLGRPVEIGGDARYYFGLPVAAGRVDWRVVREPLWEPFARFGLWRSPPPAPPRTVASGSTTVDESGRFAIRFTPEADERLRPQSFRFRVEAELVDEGGETRSGSLSLALGWVAVRLAVAEAPFLVERGEGAEWTLERRDLDGGPRAGATRWRVLELEQPAAPPLPADLPQAVDPARERYATAGDRLRPRWAPAPESPEILAGWPERQEVAAGELEHGADGDAVLKLPALAPGAYRLVAETRDRHGETARLEHSFAVVGRERGELALPLVLRFAAPRVEVGGTARLLVHSGLELQTIVVEVTHGDELRLRRTLVAGREPAWIELPIRAADRGGLGARAVVVADHQVVQRAAEVEVPWRDQRLEVELSSFRDELEPGAAETFRVTVRDADGAPLGAGAAELVASMYDRSLDLFRAHEVPRGDGLWPRFGSPPPLESGLGGRGAVWAGGRNWRDIAPPPSFRADAFVEIEPYGVGGPGARRLMMARGAVVSESVAVASPQAADARQQEIVALGELEAKSARPAADEPSPEPVELRTDFSETAFWEPHLVTGDDGAAVIEFRVPESLTSWTVWVSAWTRELASGYLEREVRTVKELLVRPYLPRFLREGDRAEIPVVVQNAGERELAGEVRFALVDPDSGADLSAEFGLPAGGARASFAAAPGGGDDLRFTLVAPRGVRPVAVRVEARAGALADGEQRPLPLLPSRIRLTQSRFAALHEGERRELRFADLTVEDPTRIDEQLVVTVDAQLFYGLLDALPYLVDYPYECTEQTLNRFVSTAVLGSFFDRYPALQAAAKRLAERDTRWERFDAADPNRRLLLEETPWLGEAQGGGEGDETAPLLRVLDPDVARAVRAESLARLAQAQLPSGAFPWFPGGPPSPYMSLYLLAGFARVAEAGGEIPLEMVARGWSYVGTQIESEWWQRAMRDDCCWELLTFANYVASSYPDPAVMNDVLPVARRREILDFSFRHWREHAPQSKLQLALTLHRMGRKADARLVLDAIFDSAKSDRDLGTYWAPEERAWLWYNDTVETHAWALRALAEVAPGDERLPGLVQWLFLQKKLGHWKSTRATAEVIHAVAGYLAGEQRLAEREELAITVGGETAELVFEPERYTGKKRQIVLEGAEIVPERDATTVVELRRGHLAFASATWHFSTERLPAEARGDLFRVERRWYRRETQGSETTLVPLAEGARLQVGDELEVQISVRAAAAAEYVHLRDPRPAGLEPGRADSGWRWDLGLAYYEETRDSGTHFFFERLPAGEYTLRYRLRAATAGTFRAAPTQLQSMYAPEFAAYSAGAPLSIVAGD